MSAEATHPEKRRVRSAAWFGKGTSSIEKPTAFFTPSFLMISSMPPVCLVDTASDPQPASASCSSDSVKPLQGMLPTSTDRAHAWALKRSTPILDFALTPARFCEGKHDGRCQTGSTHHGSE